MLSQNFSCILLQLFVFCTFIIPNNGGKTPRMRWVSKGSKAFVVNVSKIQEAIFNSGAFQDAATENIDILESIMSKQHALVLCQIPNAEGTMITLLYAALSGGFDHVQLKVVLNAIGAVLEVKEPSNEDSAKVKYEAELYVKSQFTFQPIWHLSAPDDNSGETQQILELFNFWVVVPEPETRYVVLDKKEVTGNSVTVTNMNPVTNELEKRNVDIIKTPFSKVFEKLWTYMDKGLAFEDEFEIIKPESRPSADQIISKLRNCVPWLTLDVKLTLIAQTHDVRMVKGDPQSLAYYSTIFQTSALNGKTTIFAIWTVGILQPMHVSLPATLRETLSSYGSFWNHKLYREIYSYYYGLAWWERLENILLRKETLAKLTTTLKEASPQLENCTLQAWGLLPNHGDIDYQSNQNICVIYQNADSSNFPIVLVAMRTIHENNSKIFIIKEIVDNQKTLDAANTTVTYISKYQISYSLDWFHGSLENVDLRSFKKSLLLYLDIENHEILSYSKNQDKLLVVMKFKDLEGATKVSFVALKELDEGCCVTWLGESNDLFKVHENIHQSKLEAEIYHNSTFAYQEGWELPVEDVIINNNEDEIEKEFCSWTMPNPEHKVRIIVSIYDKIIYTFWYESYEAGTRRFESEKFNDVGSVLKDLASNFENTLVFPQLFDSADAVESHGQS